MSELSGFICEHLGCNRTDPHTHHHGPPIHLVPPGFADGVGPREPEAGEGGDVVEPPPVEVQLARLTLSWASAAISEVVALVPANWTVQHPDDPLMQTLLHTVALVAWHVDAGALDRAEARQALRTACASVSEAAVVVTELFNASIRRELFNASRRGDGDADIDEHDEAEDRTPERTWVVVRLVSPEGGEELFGGAVVRFSGRTLTLQTAAFQDKLTGLVHPSRWMSLNRNHVQAVWQASQAEAMAVCLSSLVDGAGPKAFARAPWGMQLKHLHAWTARVDLAPALPPA